ncbi:lipase member I-like [Contarinia nasturtii]|uniref:lipase member I-like n=1 Tax=Contarinia nasturtii TaxID=265458 RepID=UPI0012D404AF|nr:lipase member I-like [Contarinia nasturtii]
MTTKSKKRSILGIGSFKHKLDKVRIIFFQGNSFSTQRTYELDESCAMFGNAQFDVLRKTVLYIHSYLEGPEHESVNTIVDAYLQRNDHNVLIMDWSQLAKGNYLIDVVPNAKQLATKMSEVVLDWVDEGMDVNRFHVIGHGIGGQMAGMIGRCAHRKSEGETKLMRVTALDPPAAFPLGARVNEKDAEFVDIIFTDAWFHSTPKSSGTVNFWPSCPQRKSKLSDDRRAWQMWAETVQPSEQPVFLSVHAKGLNDFKKGRVNHSEIVQMGIDCPMSAKRGDYFLQVNLNQPYAKGIKGLKYEKSRIDLIT